MKEKIDLKITIFTECIKGKFQYRVISETLGIITQANTPRQALVYFANKLKQVKAEKVLETLKGE